MIGKMQPSRHFEDEDRCKPCHSEIGERQLIVLGNRLNSQPTSPLVNWPTNQPTNQPSNQAMKQASKQPTETNELTYSAESSTIDSMAKGMLRIQHGRVDLEMPYRWDQLVLGFFQLAPSFGLAYLGGEHCKNKLSRTPILFFLQQRLRLLFR